MDSNAFESRQVGANTVSSIEKLEQSADSEFAPFQCPLEGVSLIEASAGTGKTWNICALYVRLLVEKALKVEQILVVTFTKAATAELHERIRARLAELVHALASAEAVDDPFIVGLLALLEQLKVTRAQAKLRLESALHGFDQAAIYTVHAFCQRALQEAPFAAGMPFECELQTDDAATRLELAVEFWRTQVEPTAAAHPYFAAWLVEHGAAPATLSQEFARYTQKPLARLIFGANQLDPIDQAHPPPLAALFEAARSVWQMHQSEIAHQLAEALPALNANTYKPATVAVALDAWEHYFAVGNPLIALGEKAELLTTAILEKRTKKGCAVPHHAFFELANELVNALSAVDAINRAHWLSLLATWLSWAKGALREKKRAQRQMSFNDLLMHLHTALKQHQALAGALRQRYAAALIDEFQDTDPLQFDILSRIFAPHGPLFLVGDPKQAIYSFRAADLHTYLMARKQAYARYTLTVNQRSSASLIAAGNRLFSANAAAFVLPGLEYRQVHASPRARAPFIEPSGLRPVSAVVYQQETEAQPADCRVWLLPQGDAVLTKPQALRAAAQACAAEIARLLAIGTAAPSSEAAAQIGTTPLSAGQIAVLVQTHRQGSLMKQVLAEWSIGSVELAQISVFETQDAAHLEHILLAIDAPGDLRRLRAALATDWIGIEARVLHAMDANEQALLAPSLGLEQAQSEGWADWIERFVDYRRLWHERGFAFMWRTLLRNLRIAQRLAVQSDGERRLTDLGHLAELAQAYAAKQPGIEPVLRWLAIQRAERGGGDEAQLRLESDRDLVQIVTVHKAKGLEYAVVFCPFLHDGATRTAPSGALPGVCEYHDEQGHAVIHYGAEQADAERAKEAARYEQAAERVRLIYVALTRAIYRCYLVAGSYLSGPQRSTKQARQSMLNWLVAGAGYDFSSWLAKTPTDEEIFAGWHALAKPPLELAPIVLEAIHPQALMQRELITIESLPRPTQPLQAPLPLKQQALLCARVGHRSLLASWRFASFSSLFSRADSAAPIESSDTSLAYQADDILHFPRGIAAGEYLHRLFELTDFTQPASWPAAVDRVLQERPLPTGGEPAVLRSMLTGLLSNLANTELTPGLKLIMVNPKRVFRELEFTFSADALDLSAVRELLKKHGYLDVTFEAKALAGYIKGAIDFVFEHAGQFWIVDWKSNYLGATPAHYNQASLHAAMSVHGYHLQALLYTLAVHRYLRIKQPAYDYATHYGGYAYLFVRGVRPDWQTEGQAAGVHHHKPPLEVIDALDRLMQGERA
ncbi:MAG: DNA helicase/exodeoxyribonuclease V, beta subunit [Glomeribacter sp. 1016415]|nr:DNA helicase/exodeoxyribonuclease V, beta subunit [Glomeribacter sp. 1016415]